jgi:hypothetical protein
MRKIIVLIAVVVGNRPAPDHLGEEEPAEPALHAIGRVDEGNDHRGQRVRVGSCYSWRKGSMGTICS